MTSLQGWTFSMLTLVLENSSSETKRGLQQTVGDLHPTASNSKKPYIQTHPGNDNFALRDRLLP
jgi:hypothetical protein